MSALPPPFEFLLHPTDLSPESEPALQHALRLGLGARGTLRLFHVRAREQAHVSFPSVHGALHRWGMLPDPDDAHAFGALGLTVEKAEVVDADPVEAIARDATWHEADLLVMATHARSTLARAFARNVAEPASRRAHVPTLFLPHGARGFVDAATGEVRLRRVLVPVGGATSPQLAIEGAIRMLHTLRPAAVALRVFHVGEPGHFPRVTLPEHEGWAWERRAMASVEVVDSIVGEAGDWEADLIVMATSGHDGALDMLLGSHAERVVRASPCPVLAMPAGGE